MQIECSVTSKSKIYDLDIITELESLFIYNFIL